MSKFPPYPLFLHLAGRPALVVGGGRVGLRKVAGLLAAGARVSVASVEFTAALRDLGTKKAVVLRPGAYAPALIREEPWALVFAATDSPTVNAAVLRDAQAAGVWCCRCDEPEAGDFSGGALHQESGLTLAVSTHGASPALAAAIRDQLRAQLDPVLSEWSALLADWRAEVLAAVPDAPARRALLKRLASTEMGECLRHDGRAEAQRRFRAWLGAATSQSCGEPHAA